jgi:hypothetical protein
MVIEFIDPATGEKLETYEEMLRAEVDDIRRVNIKTVFVA